MYGVDDGARTHDDRNHNPGLYQLSYVHHNSLYAGVCLVRLAGFEPATLGLEGRCSIRVSYRRRILNLEHIFHQHWKLLTKQKNGRGREITPGSMPSALRAALRAFEIAPGNFVEL
jgi:hypothetical protein